MKNSKEVRFSIGEKEIIKALQEQFGVPYIVAADYMIRYKQEQVLYHLQQGNIELAKVIQEELGG